MTSTHSKRVFISDRRDDAAPHARNIEQALNERFGDDRVFLDQRDIEAGVEFPRRIAEALEASDVVVVVIGGKWANIEDSAGQRRLDNPQDFVRIEIATALQTGIASSPYSSTMRKCRGLRHFQHPWQGSRI